MNSVNAAGCALEAWWFGLPDPGGWEELIDYEHSGVNAGGSGNYSMLGNAADLVWNPRNRDACVRSWLELFRRSERQFLLNEANSIIYSGWHVISVICVYTWAKQNSDVSLERAAERWLKNWWSISYLTRTQYKGRPYLVLCGMRSTGVPVDNYFSHHAMWAEASGSAWGDRVNAEERIKNKFFGYQDVWIDNLIVGLSRYIKESAYQIVTAKTWEDVIAACPCYTYGNLTVNFYRTSRGVCSWVGDDDATTDDDPNGNTLGLLALCEEGGNITSLPKVTSDGLLGPHYRLGGTFASCEREGRQLHYKNSNPDIGDGWITLPSGTLIYHIQVKPGGWVVNGESPIEPPVKPDPPSPDIPIPDEPFKVGAWQVNDREWCVTSTSGAVRIREIHPDQSSGHYRRWIVEKV